MASYQINNTKKHAQIDKINTHSIMTKKELKQTQEFIMKESLCLTYMYGLDNSKEPLMTRPEAKKDDNSYKPNIQDAINTDIPGLGAFLKIGNGAIRVAPSVFKLSKVSINKGLDVSDNIGRRTYLYLKSTVIPAVNSTYDDFTFGTINQVNKISPNATNKYVTNSSTATSAVDDFVNSAIPGIPITNKSGSIGWTSTATTVYLESTKSDIENGIKLIKSIQEKIINLFEKENNDK